MVSRRKNSGRLDISSQMKRFKKAQENKRNIKSLGIVSLGDVGFASFLAALQFDKETFHCFDDIFVTNRSKEKLARFRDAHQGLLNYYKLGNDVNVHIPPDYATGLDAIIKNTDLTIIAAGTTNFFSPEVQLRENNLKNVLRKEWDKKSGKKIDRPMQIYETILNGLSDYKYKDIKEKFLKKGNKEVDAILEAEKEIKSLIGSDYRVAKFLPFNLDIMLNVGEAFKEYDKKILVASNPPEINAYALASVAGNAYNIFGFSQPDEWRLNNIALKIVTEGIEELEKNYSFEFHTVGNHGDSIVLLSQMNNILKSIIGSFEPEREFITNFVNGYAPKMKDKIFPKKIAHILKSSLKNFLKNTEEKSKYQEWERKIDEFIERFNKEQIAGKNKSSVETGIEYMVDSLADCSWIRAEVIPSMIETFDCFIYKCTSSLSPFGKLDEFLRGTGKSELKQSKEYQNFKNNPDILCHEGIFNGFPTNGEIIEPVELNQYEEKAYFENHKKISKIISALIKEGIIDKVVPKKPERKRSRERERIVVKEEKPNLEGKLFAEDNKGNVSIYDLSKSTEEPEKVISLGNIIGIELSKESLFAIKSDKIEEYDIKSGQYKTTYIGAGGILNSCSSLKNKIYSSCEGLDDVKGGAIVIWDKANPLEPIINKEVKEKVTIGSVLALDIDNEENIFATIGNQVYRWKGDLDTEPEIFSSDSKSTLSRLKVISEKNLILAKRNNEQIYIWSFSKKEEPQIRFPTGIGDFEVDLYQEKLEIYTPLEKKLRNYDLSSKSFKSVKGSFFDPKYLSIGKKYICISSGTSVHFLDNKTKEEIHIPVMIPNIKNINSIYLKQ